MDFIIEFHQILNSENNSFQTRIIKYDDFEEYKTKIKNGNSFIVNGILEGSSLSITRYVPEILSEIHKILIYKFDNGITKYKCYLYLLSENENFELQKIIGSDNN